MSLSHLTPAQLAPFVAAAMMLGGAAVPALATPAALATAPAIAAAVLELLALVEGGASLVELVEARMPDDSAVVVRVLEQLRAAREAP